MNVCFIENMEYFYTTLAEYQVILPNGIPEVATEGDL